MKNEIYDFTYAYVLGELMIKTNNGNTAEKYIERDRIASTDRYLGENCLQRRHYILIANIIRTAPLSSPHINRMLLAKHTASIFEQTQSNFNREKFIKACETLDL